MMLRDYYERIFSLISFTKAEEFEINNLISNILKGNNIYVNHEDKCKSVLFANYIREVWVAESPPDKTLITKTNEIVDLLVEGSLKPDFLNDYQWKKLQNIYSALDLIFSNNEIYVLTVEMIKEIHNMIGNGIMQNHGQFRNKNVIALNSTVNYVHHNYIEERLSILLLVLNNKLSSIPVYDTIQERIKFMLKLASFFFSEFLFIHPFNNGNGRVARILFNMILKQDISFPFTLFLFNREEYIQILEKRNNCIPPSDLTYFALLACNRTSSLINWLFIEEA